MIRSSCIDRPEPPRIVLLDLNYTLVENSGETMIRRAYPEERYRLWLVDLIRDLHVILITVRGAVHREYTLARIAEQTGGWQPQEAHFNERDARAETWKAHVLHKMVLPKHGAAAVASYLAIESNREVHRVYDAAGVPWCKVEKEDRWTDLPTWTNPRPLDQAQPTR